MAERILQRFVMPLGQRVNRLYYRSNGRVLRPRKSNRRELLLPRGTILRSDTWFNSFFESYWRCHTFVSQVSLRLHVSGTGVLRLYRRSEQQAPSLVREITFSGRHRELSIEGIEGHTESGRFGLLYFELVARSPLLRLHQAEWVAHEVWPRPTRLVAGFCTFNRASQLIRNVKLLLADADVVTLLERIVVVDQGEDRVRDHSDFPALARVAEGRLQLVHQSNLGGAGGFTRCLIEAQNTSGATHVLLMDDDIVVEPESVLRAAAFLSLARRELAVGGHMLNRFRPTELIESGSRYLPEAVRIDEPRRYRLDRAEDLLPFIEPQARHYNGWWFLAFSLSVLKRTGLPLPLFLRGDDLVFGYRLRARGVSTVALPGVAVWHEPLERKGRAWHAYYELRNYLILGALHFPFVRAATVARRFLSRLLDELLAYDYYEAWLLCEAVAAYLRGPDVLRRPPLAIHRSLQEMGRKLAPPIHPQEVEGQAAIPAAATSVPRFSPARRWWLVLRNFCRASPAPESRPQRVLQGGGEQWYDVAGADVVGVMEPQHSQMVVLRRSRPRYQCLFFRSIGLALRLLISHHLAVERWRNGAYLLTSKRFWMEYMQLQGGSTQPLPDGRGSDMAVATVIDGNGQRI